MIDFLKTQSFNVELRNEQGQTALELAIDNAHGTFGSDLVIEFLVSIGCKASMELFENFPKRCNIFKKWFSPADYEIRDSRLRSRH